MARVFPYGRILLAAAVASTFAAPGATSPPPCTYDSCPVCFGDAKAEGNNISVYGPDGLVYRLPFRLPRPHAFWDSMSMSHTVLGILMRERLGVAVEYVGVWDEYDTMYGMLGCAGWADYECGQAARTPAEAERLVTAGLKTFADPLPDFFAAVEIWPASMDPAELGVEPARFDEVGLVGLGSSGLTSKTWMWVVPEADEAAWSRDQVVLTNYRAWTADLAARYVSTPRAYMDAGIEAEIPGCPGTPGLPAIVTDGFQALSELGYVCRDSWWLTPACATLGDQWWDQCVAVLDDDWGYPKPDLYSALAAVGFRAAKIVLGYDGMYEALHSRMFNSSFLWWDTDTQFLALKPRSIQLPAQSDTPIQIVQKVGLSSAVRSSKQIELLFNRFALSLNSLQTMLSLVVDAQAAGHGSSEEGQPGFFQKLACDWLRGYEEIWQPWLPSVDSCSVGEVFDSEIEECVACPAGTFFQNSAAGAACVRCPPGRSQADSGQLECLPCGPGSAQGREGATSCTPCHVGSFSNSSGQTECLSCSAGKRHPELYATQVQIEIHGQLKWVPTSGASSPGMCGCSEGAYDKDGECVSCGEGMLCPGFGEVVILPSYFATSTEPGFVFRCFGADNLRCPGGPPGTCAAGRLNTTLACTSCAASMRSGDRGSCTECGGGDVLPLIGAVIAGLALAVVLYLILERDEPAARSKGAMFIAITGSQCFTLLQQLSVFGSIALHWATPFRQLIDALAIFTFKLDYLQLECAVTLEPESMFLGRIVTVFGFFLLIVLIHCGSVILLHHGAFRERMPMLMGAAGTIFSAFFISIVSTVLSPFQCNESPNGISTVNAYPSVVCFHDEYGSNHSSMVVVASLACAIPLGFLAFAAYVVYRLPGKLARGDTGFLKAFAFLFFRFNPSAYWFVLVFLGRNLIISVVPVVNNASVQVLILHAIIIPVAFATVYARPWAVGIANLIDITTSALLSGLVIIFALNSDQLSPDTLAQLCCAVVAGAFSAIAVAICFGVYLRCIRSKKEFQFFICHHKAGAGNLARLLKMWLNNSPQVTRKVFVDSDDLRDLGNLFGYVASDTETLVVLCSKEILSRPWCMGEVTTAKLNNVHLVKVILPDFQWPAEEFIQNYLEHVPGASSLTRHGLGVQEVQAAIQWLQERRSLRIQAAMSASLMNHLVSLLVKSSKLATEAEVTCESAVSARKIASDSSKNMIVVDAGNLEACCTALVMVSLLAAMMQNAPAEIPTIMDEEAAHAPAFDVQQLCLVCTNGVFRSALVLRVLLRAAESSTVAVLPVVSEPTFRFPTKVSLEELEREVVVVLRTMGSPYGGGAVVKLVERIFTEIAVEVNPQDAEDILVVRVQGLAGRLRSGLRHLGLELDRHSLAGRPDSREGLGTSKAGGYLVCLV